MEHLRTLCVFITIFLTFTVGINGFPRSALQVQDRAAPTFEGVFNTPEVPVGHDVNHVGTVYENYTAFISYRRSSSRSLAMLIKVLLDREKIPAFLDVEDLDGGNWDDQLMERLDAAPRFILVLSKGTLDRCLNDLEYKDVMHQEIREAVLKEKHIIPIFDEYDFPDATLYSPEIQTAMRAQGVNWQHHLTEASFERLVDYLNMEKADPKA